MTLPRRELPRRRALAVEFLEPRLPLASDIGDAPPALAAGPSADPLIVLDEGAPPAIAVHAADLDGDGDMDVVATFGPGAGGITGKLIWGENDGAGGFLRRVIDLALPSSASTHALDVADLDRDGDLDIIVAPADNQIVWYEGDGQGGFTKQFTNAPVATSTTVSVVDVDGDEHLDLVSTRRDPATNGLAWYKNDGQQNFSLQAVNSSAPPSQGFVAVTPADVDGDGLLDFVVTGSRVEWFRATGVGYTRVDLFPSSTTPALVGDMDGDGDLDIVVGSSIPTAPPGRVTALVLENLGAGAFATRIVGYAAPPLSSLSNPLALGDLDGDGDLDIAGAGGSWLENTGGLAFANRPEGPLQFGSRSVFVADVDGDGALDTLAAAGVDGVVWFRNQIVADADFGDAPAPYGTGRTESGPFHGGSGPRLGASRTVDGDGVPAEDADGDAGDDGVTFGVLRAGAAGAQVTVNVQNAPAGARLDAWIDFNGDGVWSAADEQIAADVAVEEGDNTLTFTVPATAVSGTVFARFRLSTTGGLRPEGGAADGEVEDYAAAIAAPAEALSYEARLGPNSASNTSAIATVDLDGDGDLDMLQSSASIIDWSEDLGGGVWLSHKFLGVPFVGAAAIKAVDYDRDGDMDVILASNGPVGLLENNGAQSFAYRPLSSMFPNIVSLDVLDLDGDGDFDILPIQATSPGQVRWLRNEGGYLATLQTIASPNSQASAGRWGDVDRDGDVDLVVSGSTSAAPLSLLINNGSGAFTARQQAAVGVHSLELADLDRDGDLDIVALVNAAGAPVLEWFENDGDEFFERRLIGESTLSTSQSSSNRLAVVDPDGDGDFDVVVAEGAQLRWFRNDGAESFAPTVVSPPVGMNPFHFVHAADVNDDGDLELLTPGGWFESRSSVELPLTLVSAPDFAPPYLGSDEIITGNDFLWWQRFVGQTVAAGAATDWDRSGVVDGGDLALWTQFYGAGRLPDTDWIYSPPAEPMIAPAVQASAEPTAEPTADPAADAAIAANVVLSLETETAESPQRTFAPRRRRDFVAAVDKVFAATALTLAPPAPLQFDGVLIGGDGETPSALALRLDDAVFGESDL